MRGILLGIFASILSVSVGILVNNNIFGCEWSLDIPVLRRLPIQNSYKAKIICHSSIMVLYDFAHKFPFATYAIHTKEQMQQLEGGRKDFTLDPLIEQNEQHATNDTVYKPPMSRGHLTPSHIMSYDKSENGAWSQTYYMSNILPQDLHFNEVEWAHFESNIINELNETDAGTKWEIYTGGFWNGNYSSFSTENDSYLFWKAFCERETCQSALITAYKKEGKQLLWKLQSVSPLLDGIFLNCCNEKVNVTKWRNLIPYVKYYT